MGVVELTLTGTLAKRRVPHTVVDERKLREDVLSRTHPSGRIETVLFARLGYTLAVGGNFVPSC